jgi:hypothetical protein
VGDGDGWGATGCSAGGLWRRRPALGRPVAPAAVAGDREQPGPDRVRRLPVGERPVRPQERVLERILAVLAVADHVRQKASSDA